MDQVKFSRDDVEASMLGLELERMYWHQRQLMIALNESGKLPFITYETINTPEHQAHFRAIHGALIEELFELQEAFEEHSFLVNMPDVSLGWSEVLESLNNVNSEYADCVHFMLELIILVGIKPIDITERFRKGMVEAGFVEYNNMEISLESIFNGVSVLNVMQQKQLQRGSYKELKLIDYVSLLSTDADEIAIGLKVSNEVCKRLSEEIFEVQRSLYNGTKLLKMKPWRLNGPKTDEVVFKTHIIDSFLSLLSMAVLLGANHKTTYHQFIKKVVTNLNRIQNNY